MKVVLVYFLIAIVSVTFGYGQIQIPAVINVTGGTEVANGYSVQWSVGELTIVNQMTSSDSSYVVTNGFIQPYPGKKATLPAAVPLFSLGNIKVFPNPTHDILEINCYQIKSGEISIQLSNQLGQVVYSHEVIVSGPSLVEKINMQGFKKGIYLLYIRKLNPDSGEYNIQTGSYKIIKQ